MKLNRRRVYKFIHEINDKIAITDSLDFAGIIGFHVSVNNYEPVSGGSYFKLSPYLTNKNALINIKNEGNERCFWYSLILGMVTPEVMGKNPQEEYKYKKSYLPLAFNNT